MRIIYIYVCGCVCIKCILNLATFSPPATSPTPYPKSSSSSSSPRQFVSRKRQKRHDGTRLDVRVRVCMCALCIHRYIRAGTRTHFYYYNNNNERSGETSDAQCESHFYIILLPARRGKLTVTLATKVYLYYMRIMCVRELLFLGESRGASRTTGKARITQFTFTRAFIICSCFYSHCVPIVLTFIIVCTRLYGGKTCR